MANIKLYTKCPFCGGDGIRQLYDATVSPTLVELPCGPCDSTGYIQEIELDSTLLEDMDDKLDNIIDKLNDIWEKLNE